MDLLSVSDIIALLAETDRPVGDDQIREQVKKGLLVPFRKRPLLFIREEVERWNESRRKRGRPPSK